MATCAAWQAPPGARPNRGDARLFSAEESLDPSPDRCPGWLLEAAGNGRPRGMAIARETTRHTKPGLQAGWHRTPDTGRIRNPKSRSSSAKADIAPDFAHVSA